jgi:hypothetical protein
MSSLVVTLALALSAAADGGASPDAAPAVLAPSLVAPPKKPAPPADRAYELRRATDGSGDLIYEGAGFRARIARDGTTRFQDKHFSLVRSWSFLPFAPQPGPAGRASLQSTIVDLLGRRAPHKNTPDPADPPAEPLPLKPRMSPYRPDPAEACTYPRSCYFEAPVILVAFAGTFDLTDELMRLAGEDPYRHEKAHFLAATSPLRGGLAARALGENVRRAEGELPARLEAIACDDTRSVRERRATIEALRGEIDGDAPGARTAVVVIDHFLSTRFVGAGGAPICAAAPAATRPPGSD